MMEAHARPIRAFLAGDAFKGLLLIAVAICALALANSSLEGAYHALFHDPLPWSPVGKLETLHLWINDALMAVFFFGVGLEVKHELVVGRLSGPKALRLPLAAASAGIAVPAAIYLAIAGDDHVLRSGWAIPSATDIAFVLGLVALLGSRVPPPLRVFLLTVAVIDDVGAVLIIAFVYTGEIEAAWLFASLVMVAALVLLNWLQVARAAPYALAAVLLWYCVLHANIHATVAGVIAALTIPMERRDGSPFLETVEKSLQGWIAYLVVPLFGLANAGVDLRGIGLAAFAGPLPLAIAAGLIVGKQVGVFGAVALACRLGIAGRPEGASWLQIWGASVLCGVGFTMSLFIGTMAFPTEEALYERAKLGMLAGTLVSAVLGYAILRLAGGDPARREQADRPARDGG